MESIVEALSRCGSDKVSRGAGPGSHSYGDTYRELLTPLRDTAKSILEIGVFRGASMRAWHSFFKHATIVGVDIQPRPGYVIPRDRAVCVVANATNPNVVAKLVAKYAPFDVIIDDGSHDPKEQKAACKLLLKHVRAGGIYVIEDVRSIEVARSLAREFRGEVRDLRAMKGMPNDILVIFRKPKKS
jgi:predicted O-methyltransferase YrrM